MNNPEQYGSVKKKAANISSFQAGPQALMQDPQIQQAKSDQAAPSAYSTSQFSTTSQRDSSNMMYQNGNFQQSNQYRLDLSATKKEQGINDQEYKGANISKNKSIDIKDFQIETDQINENKLVKQKSGSSKIKNQNSSESKKSIQKSNSDSSDPQIIIQYNSDEEDGEESDEDNAHDNQFDDDGEEEYKNNSANNHNSQKNLNGNAPQKPQQQEERRFSDNRQLADTLSQNGANRKPNQSPYQPQNTNQSSKASPINQNRSINGIQHQGEIINQNQENKKFSKDYNSKDIEEDCEEYNIQASSKVENQIQNMNDQNPPFNQNSGTTLEGVNGYIQKDHSNNTKKSIQGYKINSIHLNNHEQYLQQAITTSTNNQEVNKQRSHSNNSLNVKPFNSNTDTKSHRAKTIFDRIAVNGETQNTQNTPQNNRLSALEEKFSTEQSERLNEQQFTSYNTNWNQSISPEKQNRLSNQINIKETNNSFYKEKEADQLESEANHIYNINQPKDKESLIQFEDASKENSFNSKGKRKLSFNEHEDHVLQRNALNKESFEIHYSNNKHNQMFLDSSHQLKEIEESQLKRIISDTNHQKKNLLIKDELAISNNNNLENQDLGKHIGKEIVIIPSSIANNNQNNQGGLKQLQSERVNTKSSSQSKLQTTALNKLELEKKKERKIQKFCQKFFKDLLKNRSGVPTLTQNNRKMNLDSETPNPDYNQQRSAKEGLLNEDLRKELFNIEEHQKYRLVMDQFLKKFNKNPKEAIQFLIEKQLCDDSDEDIAYMLLTTEGLNKEQLGQFFGSNKERNQKILEAFCGLMDFRNLRFDEAMRLFLSRFRLPGESQQIDRIVQKFTKVYSNDNPTIFKDEDTPYILCYSAIMLNVDAHSEKIEKNRKMQKSTFVSNNLQCTRNAVSKEFLEQLYDNIVKEKFETKVDYIEKIYSRVPIDSMKTQFDGQNRIRIIKELQNGYNFLKYGRYGKPHMRKVFINEARDKIVWNEVSEQPQMNNPLNNNANQKPPGEKKFKQRYILIKDITDLTLGSNATEVMKKNNVPPEFDQFCFSIITSKRTLDLKSNDMDTKFKWIAFLYNDLNDKRQQRKNKASITPEQKQINQERINEIWRLDIFSKWEDHWDYTSSKPKNITKYEKKQQKSNFLSSICSCLSKRSQNGNIKTLNEENNSNSSQLPFGSKKDYEELDLAHQNNKSLLLISLWKIGMPKWVRKTIWPLSIGNRLEITENLYKILLKQVQVSENNIGIANNQIMISIEKMKADLSNKSGKRFFSQFNAPQLKMLENVLSAFIFYRPDVGYINEAMPNLAAVLISQLDEEYTVFKAFINLLHSYHFLTFFRGEMSEIKWRVQFFNEYLQKRMHLVLQHFKALDLSSELFLMHWFLNLFSNVFDQETVLRIWDNFLLEGEVFAYKAGIAFIEYFHLEFKMATFDDAINFLKNPPDDIFCSDLYFDIIEDIKIPVKDFNDRLDQQNVAKLAPYILQQLL
ncbi:hypothetical protein ABPG74_013657 [Tetrahymena malaccensis]